MAPRANWKGHLRLDALSCPVALYTAASAAERVSFTLLNRASGNRVRRAFVEEESGKPVPREEQVKGYDLGEQDYVLLEQAEIDAAVPEPTKVLEIAAFVAADAMDLAFLDQPYYLAPAGAAGGEVFALLRESLAAEGVGALASTVIFRRLRHFFVVPYGQGLLAHSLHFDYEIRSAEEVFEAVPGVKIPAEMHDLAEHIIATKRGRFDPADFDDRYDAALVEVIRAKQAGRPVKRAAPPRPSGKVVDLMEALRRSAGQAGGKGAGAKGAGGRGAGKRKATTARKPAAAKGAARRKAG